MTQSSIEVLSGPGMSVVAPTIRVGTTTASIEPEGIRTLTVGGREVIQRCYVAVRDTQWHTLELLDQTVRVDITDDETRLEVAGLAQAPGIDLSIAMSFRITPGVLTAEFSARANAESWFNRAGICLLIAPDVAAGRPAVLRRDSLSSARTLPSGIGPQLVVDGVPQPLFEAFESIAIALTDGGHLSIDTTGDLFEIEDQRNWSDNSFKIYSTPLSLGIPRRLRPGEELRQSVRAEVDGIDAPCCQPEEPPNASPSHWRAPERVGPLPSLGTLSRSPGAPPPAPWTHVMVPGPRPDCATLSGRVNRAIGPSESVRSMPEGFVAFNRSETIASPFTGLALPINATVHAADTASIRSSLGTHSTIARTVRERVGQAELHIGPIDFLEEAGEWRTGNLPRLCPGSTSLHPRRHGPFAAAWLVVSLAHLMKGGPTSVTYFDVTCASGVDGTPTPVGQVVAFLSPRVGLDTYRVVHAQADAAALAWSSGPGWDIIAANVSTDIRRIPLDPHVSLAIGPEMVIALRGWHYDTGPIIRNGSAADGRALPHGTHLQDNE